MQVPPVIEKDIGAFGKVREAFEIASAVHAGQVRKHGDRPYIEHPLGVAALVRQSGCDEDAIAASLLHDVVEDSDDWDAKHVRERFGLRVAELVETLSDDPDIAPYERRKADVRRRVEAAGRDAAAIYGADKLSNVKDIRMAYLEEGERVAEKFPVSLDERVRLWESDLEMLERVAPDLPYLDEFRAELGRLHTDRAAG